MKNQGTTLNMVITLIFISLVGVTCMRNNKDEIPNTLEDSKKIAEEHNDAKFTKAEEKDAQFLVDAATMNLSEIQLGDLAISKGMSTDIKELGRTMNEAHSKAQSDLIKLAEDKRISIPTSIPSESLKEFNSLKEESNQNFDKAYTDLMVDGHKEAILRFEKASTECKDADIREWASKMLPELRIHLDHAMNYQTKLSASK